MSGPCSPSRVPPLPRPAPPRRGDDRPRLAGASPRIGLLGAVLLASWLGPMAPVARPQSRLRDFSDPILVVNSGGHTGEVMDLEFSGDGAYLLTAGLDKVVNVWDLRSGDLEPVRVLRPLHWRGLAGAIYAMALGPADRDGRRLLAVAGYGVESTRGNILLYRFPGGPESPSGDIVAAISGGGGDPPKPGHTDVVNALVFTPDGRFLASAGHDGTIHIWDVANPKAPPVGVLRGHQGPINALACVRTPRGVRLASGGADGHVRVWELEGRRMVLDAPSGPAGPGADPRAAAINHNCLAFSPDGRWVFLGREDGRLARLDVDHGGSTPLRTDARAEGQGPVESLALSPDGQTLLTCILSRRIRVDRRGRPLDPGERPRVECDVEIRGGPNFDVRERLPRASNRIRACAFGPDGRLLAYAGGDGQAVHLADLRDRDRPPVVLKGRGQSLWDVGFDPDPKRPVVGFTRARDDPPGPRPPYEGFDLVDRQFVDVDPAGLRGAIRVWQGWSVVREDPHRLRVVPAEGGGRPFPIALDPDRDGRWWDHSFLPPGPGHDGPAVAVACDGGIVIHRLSDGRRTRVLAGHGGAVYTLAPSPDGRWLATGSSDQTLRLWLLAGCDQPAPLGAGFGKDARGRWVVDRVLPRGFADLAGLERGDVVERLQITGVRSKPEIFPDPPAFLKAVEGLGPNEASLAFTVLRGDKRSTLVTTLRDGPVLTLFPGVDREWVLWMPEGYYDTSIAGDRRHLGWHVNPPREEVWSRPTAYFPAERYEAQLRRRDLLGELVATADPVRVLRPAPPPEVVRPPAVRIEVPALAGGGRVVNSPDIEVRATARTEAGRVVRSLRFSSNSRRYPPRDRAEGSEKVRLQPGANLIVVEAVDDRGIVGDGTLEVSYEPVRPDPSPRLIVRTIGVERFHDRGIPEIAFAGRDAVELGRFFLGRCAGNFGPEQIDLRALDAGDIPAEQAEAVFEELQARLDREELGRDDSVFVALESHFLHFDGARSLLVTSDAVRGGGAAPSPALSAELVAQTLERLSSYGCTVMLLLDGVHQSGPRGMKEQNRLGEWVRQLSRERGVIVLVASNSGPSRRDADAKLGVLTRAVRDSAAAPVRFGRAQVDKPLTVADFGSSVLGLVERYSGRKQFAGYYVPRTVAKRTPIFAPRSAP